MEIKNRIRVLLLLGIVFGGLNSCISLFPPDKNSSGLLEFNLILWIIAGVIFIIYVIIKSVSGNKDK